MQPEVAEEFLSPMGVSADTGRPLAELSDSAVEAMLIRESERSEEMAALREKSDPSNVNFAVTGDFDGNKLEESGWGVIFAPGVAQEIKDALKPLIDHRKEQSDPFAIYDGPTAPLPGESAQDWLRRNKVRLDVVNPEKGVPFYLLLVGPPESLSFEFQYVLDLYWAVGRLWFETPDEFRQYAESVIRYEKAATVETTNNAAIFATEHEFDNATQLFMRHVARTLASGEGANPVPLGKRQKFGLKTFLGEQASKSQLVDLLSGRADGGTPSLLFSGSHGMQFGADDRRQTACQGALVCQDWEGFGKITEDHWFAASDVPQNAKLHGLIHVFFACHGGGCPALDNFDRMNNEPRRIAQRPFFARLPQTLLAHPNGGALAVLAHIERAWAFSFLGDGNSSQAGGFRDVLARIMKGARIGQATDVFNMRWAALSVQLAETHLDRQRGAEVPLKALGRMWVARDDARNFMILGDPAVRLRIESLV